MKKSFVFMLLLLIASVAFGAGEFDNVDKVVGNLDTQVSTTSGVALKNLMGWLPLILMAVGVLLGLKHSKKQADQDQDSNKVFITCGIAAIIGAIVGVLVDALIGAALMQDSMKGLQVLKEYWTKALGV